MELWKLLAHNHWLTLNLYGYRLRLCARCSGYVIGFITPLLISNYIPDPIRYLDLDVQQLTCVILALPYTFDWISQSWGLRNSSNFLRLTTGFLLGVDVFFFSRLESILQVRRIIFLGATFSVTIIGYIGKLKRQKQF